MRNKVFGIESIFAFEVNELFFPHRLISLLLTGVFSLKSMTRRINILALLFIMVCSVAGQESHSYRFSLEDCLRYAVANSYERKSMELTGKSLETTYEQSKQQRLPNLSASVGQNLSNNEEGWSTSGSVGVGSNVTIYQGGNINNTIEQNRLNLERNEVQMERYDNQLTT